MDTKTRITQAAARLFFKNGYVKTTLRMIGEEVGIAHVSILSHFDNKADIAATTWWNYIGGLRQKCDQIMSGLPEKYHDNEDLYRQMLWWTLHFNLLSDNRAFRDFLISFYYEEPVVLAMNLSRPIFTDKDKHFIKLERADEFVASSLGLAVDANLASLIGYSMIDYVQAARLIMIHSSAISGINSYTPSEAEIREFAQSYVADVEVDILNEFLLVAEES